MDRPLVSIITVCLNAEAHVARALGSVLAQTYAPIEYLVVDGGSTDGTVQVLREFEQRFDGRMRWTSEPDQGLFDAMNKGIERATGGIIGILNADDAYEPDAVARVVQALETSPEAGIAYGDLCLTGDDGRGTVLHAPESVTLAALRRGMPVFHPATFVNAETYRRVGLYDTRYRLAADYDLIFRAAEAGVGFARVDGALTVFSTEGVSNRNARRTDRDATFVRIAHGVPATAAWARHYKRIVAGSVYRALRGVPGFLQAYSWYKGSADDL